MLGALAAAGLAGSAQSAPDNPGRLPADRIATINGLCRTTLGLSPGEAHFANCVNSLSQSLRALERPAPPEGGGRQTPASYFAVSPEETHRREQDACAQLGFDRASRGFASCAAALQSAMFAADHPMN